MDVGELKRRLRRRRGTRGRYPTDLRDAVLAHASTAKAEGQSEARIALELGMSLATLQYWRAAARRRGQLVPVTIAAGPTTVAEVVVECGRVRVRGLDLAGIAELLRRLA